MRGAGVIESDDGRSNFMKKKTTWDVVENDALTLLFQSLLLHFPEQKHKRKHPGCRLRLEPARSDR